MFKPPCRNEACGGVDYTERGECVGPHCHAPCCDKCAVVLDTGLLCAECTEVLLARLVMEFASDDALVADQAVSADLKLCAEAGCTIPEAADFLGRIY